MYYLGSKQHGYLLNIIHNSTMNIRVKKAQKIKNDQEVKTDVLVTSQYNTL